MKSISEKYLNDFDLALRCKYSSNATIKNYYSCIKSFFRFAQGKQIEINELIKQYLVWGIKSKEPKTINLHRSAIVCFFKLVKNINIKVSDIPRKKEFKKLPKIINIAKIKEAIRLTINIKHRLELMLLFDCGLRLHEIVNLKRKNIITDRNILWLQNAKGNKERIIPISESVRILLYEYISDMNDNDSVFKVCSRSISKVVTNAFNRVGIKVSPHMLRHSFATMQIVNDENPFKVMSWLGHSSIKTTQLYITLSNSILSTKKDLLNENYMNF